MCNSNHECTECWKRFFAFFRGVALEVLETNPSIDKSIPFEIYIRKGIHLSINLNTLEIDKYEDPDWRINWYKERILDTGHRYVAIYTEEEILEYFGESENFHDDDENFENSSDFTTDGFNDEE